MKLILNFWWILNKNIMFWTGLRKKKNNDNDLLSIRTKDIENRLNKYRQYINNHLNKGNINQKKYNDFLSDAYSNVIIELRNLKTF